MKAVISYGRQMIDKSDIRAVSKTLNSDWLTQGPTIEKFESAVSKRAGTEFAIAVSNGTAALHAACHAIGIGPGDEVTVPTLTFTASANCVLFCGGIPVFCDIDPVTLSIDLKQVAKKITKKTRAIIAVDFAGHPADWDNLREIAKRNKLILIDDAAHSLGAKYKEKPVGSLADLTIFSFHPVKLITTAEGGMVVTNNKKYAEKIRLFRNHGIRKPGGDRPGWYQEMADLGYNYRMTDIQASLGLSQLRKLNKFIKRREEIAGQYVTAFKNVDELILPPSNTWVDHAWHLFILQFKTKNRDDVYRKLRLKGIGTQVHYLPIHLHPYYQDKLGCRLGDFPNAEKYFSRCLSIPIFPAMTDKMVQQVVHGVLSAIK